MSWRVRCALLFVLASILATTSLSQQSAPETGQPGADSYRGFENNPVGRVDIALRPSEGVDKLRELVRQQPAQPFSIEAIKENVSDLQNTGKFAQVQVSLEPQVSGFQEMHNRASQARVGSSVEVAWVRISAATRSWRAALVQTS
jgi:hypothetical protein